MGILSIWLQSEPGIAFATKKAEEVLSRSGYQVELERLRLTLPLKANIREVRVKEGDKTLLSASSVRIDVSALPLLFHHLEIDRLKASEVKLDLPKGGEVGWPTLPWKISARRIAIERLETDGVTLAAAGKVRVGRDLMANLSLDLLEPPLGHYQVDLTGKEATQDLHIKVVKEAEGPLLNLGGIAVKSFVVTGYGKLDSFGAVITGKSGRPEEQIIGDLQLVATANAKTDPIAARLIGEALKIQGVYTLDGTRTLRLTPIRGVGAAMSVDGQLIANLNGTIEKGELRMTLPDLSQLDGLIGLTYSGAVTGRVSLSGTLTTPTVALDLEGEEMAVAGRPITGLSSRFTWNEGRGTLDAEAVVADLPLTLHTTLAKSEGTFTLSPLKLTGPESEITGSLTFTESGIDSFDLKGEIGELWAWAPLLRLDVEGRATFTATYEEELLTATLHTPLLIFQYLTLDRAQITARLEHPFTAPHGEVRADAGQVSYKRVAAQEVAFATQLGGKEWPFTLTWEGLEGVSGRASGAWLATLDRFWTRWDQFGGEILDSEVTLLQPITVEKGLDQPIEFSPLSLQAGTGSLYLAYTADALTLDVERFPLEAAELILPGLGLVGEINGKVAIAELKSGGQGTLSLMAEGMELKESPITDLGSLYGSLSGELKEGRLQATLTADSSRGSPLKLTLTLPLTLSSHPLTYTIPAEGAVSGDGRFAGELAPLVQFFLPYNLQLSGNVDARMTLSGTAGDPNLKGQLLLKNGLLEEANSGARLTELDARLIAEGPHLMLESMSAKAGEGRVTATGTLDLDPKEHFPLYLSGDLENAQIVALTIAQAAVTGDLILSGPLRSPIFSGTLTTTDALINLPKRFSQTGYPNLEVTYINLPPSKREIIQRTRPVQLGLDLKVIVPDNLRIRGQGARATLGGQLEVEGTIARPSLEGALTLKKGEFTFGSKTFKLTEGTIAFDGPVEDHTRIAVTGTIRVADVEVGATISGLLPDVQLSLVSSPPLTDREIIAYLLFDSPASVLGAGEALQLAAASAEVAGGNFGPGLLSSLPKRVGLDTLTITSPAGNTEELGIRATKRISPNFDINIYKSFSSASNHLILEFNFFRAWSFRAERIEPIADDPGTDRFSLRWTHDY